MVAIELSRVNSSSSVSIMKHDVMAPARIFGYDRANTAEGHHRDFADIGGARLLNIEKDKLALQCGVQSGLVVIRIGVNRGDFVPSLDPGSYGVEHTNLGNLVTKTKRIVDVNNGTVHLVFGIIPTQWPDGLNSCTLVQADLEGRSPVNLLADDSSQPIEPTSGYRFYTPFFHAPGAGSGFTDVYPLYRLGVMTLDRQQLSELLRGFNKEWVNGPVFARKHKMVPEEATGSGGLLDEWC